MIHADVDLRLDALGLYAGQESQVEDFEAADGTMEGGLESTTYEYATNAVNSKMEEAASLIGFYWTGWWPVLHFTVNTVIAVNVTLEVDIGIDLFGIVQIYDFQVVFMNLDNLSEEDGNELIAASSPLLQSLDGTGSTWSYFFGFAAISYMIGWSLIQWGSPASAWQEIAIWIAFLSFAAFTIMGLIALAYAVAECTTDRILAAITFLTTAFLVLRIVSTCTEFFESKKGSSTGLDKYLRFFKDEYQHGAKWQKLGFSGRTHFIKLIFSLEVLIVVLIIAACFLVGSVWLWFAG